MCGVSFGGELGWNCGDQRWDGEPLDPVEDGGRDPAPALPTPWFSGGNGQCDFTAKDVHETRYFIPTVGVVL